MRQETYDNFISNFGLIAGFLLFYIVAAALICLLSWLINSGLAVIFSTEVVLKYLVINAAVLGLPISTIFWMFFLSANRYGTSRLRDFWMVLGHTVTLDRDNIFPQLDEINSWCKENCKSLYKPSRKSGYQIWIFANNEDALVFKLTWS